MAPEQILGDALDRRCDVFALGIVLYELATHQRLFKRSSDYLTARAILEEPIPRADAADPAIPAPLADVIAKALTRDVNGRYATAAELATALTAAIPLATTAELAAAVTSGEELSAMRTRQQRVLSGAREHATPTTTRGFDTATATATATEAAAETAAAAEAAIAAGTTHTAVGAARTSRPRRVSVWIVPALAISVAIVAFAIIERGDRERLDGSGSDPSGASDPRSVTVDAAAEIPLDAAASPDAGATVPTKLAVGSAAVTRPPAAAPGFFSIDSKPYATVFVDGRSIGVTPIVHRALGAGHHRLRVVLEDGRARELGVDVPSGRAAPPIVLAW